ncbi:MAG: DUF1786 domain-containing protein [Chloroflexota bacterium]
MTAAGDILAIDIGAGTQDILVYEREKTIENCVQLILPSPTVVLAGQVRQATREGQTLWLQGQLMGGGPLVWAVRQHVSAGWPAFASPAAALTLHDDLSQVAAMGVQVVDRPPTGAATITLRDLDLQTLARALAPYGVSLPATVAVAVQDHGFSPHASNRLFRFAHWQRFVEGGGEIGELLYQEPPSYLTRMQALRRDAPNAFVMDTGAAAIWGALCDETVAAQREAGLVVLNIGNAHTIAVLLSGSRVQGLFEHHTGALTTTQLGELVGRLQAGTLTHEEVFAEGGHGAYLRPGWARGGGFEFVAVTGPNRHLAGGLGYHHAVPYGDMMLAGCFGLVEAVGAWQTGSAPAV